MKQLTVEEFYTKLVRAFRDSRDKQGVPFLGRWEDRPWLYMLVGRSEMHAMENFTHDGNRNPFEVFANDLHIAVYTVDEDSHLEITDKSPFYALNNSQKAQVI